ncbi:protein kinase family protein [Vibrio splendidus]
MQLFSPSVSEIHFVFDEQVSWYETGKCYANKLDFERELEALDSCKGLYVQELIRVDPNNQRLYFKYYQHAMSLDRFGIMQVELFILLIPAVIRAIAHCHQNGWVHGDVKPANILYLPETGSIRLIDFGASFPLGISRTEIDKWQLSQQYASRNQLEGVGYVEGKDDWFALLVMIKQVISQIEDKKLQSRALYIQRSIEKLFHPTMSGEAS